MPAAPESWFFAAVPLVVLGIEAGWYMLVALAFSAEHPRRLYLRAKRWIDRAVAAAMGLLGLRLLGEAAKDVT